ncbi:MAG: GntR family transcriptional regulator [Xanthomonadales bacterium]|jgi:GntR family transcriptional regulator|nr:GntR family transcriptional regulator [Xanthomonadales bacterium]
MILVVDPHSGIPVYRQIVEQLRFQVSSGVLQPGDEIPSTRSLSVQLGVNPMTISKAYALLESEGVLERRPGLPLLVRPQGKASGHSSKLEQLEQALRPVAVKAKQMNIESSEAAEIFRRLLDEED